MSSNCVKIPRHIYQRIPIHRETDKVTLDTIRTDDTHIIGSAPYGVELNYYVRTTRLVARGRMDTPRADNTEPTRVSDLTTVFPSALTPGIPTIAVGKGHQLKMSPRARVPHCAFRDGVWTEIRMGT